MALNSPSLDVDASSTDISIDDLREFSNIFASVFNNRDMHDRLLCFEKLEGEQFASETDSHSEDSEDERSQTESENESSSINVENDTKDDENENVDEERETKLDEATVNLVQETTKIDDIIDGQEQDTVQQSERECLSSYHGVQECTNREMKNRVGKENSAMRKLFVHSQWLAAQSPYFKALFYSGMKESYSKEVIMKICEDELEAHVILIEAMYKLDALNKKDDRLIVDVLVLADKYDVRLVIKKCKYILMTSTLTLQMCDYILQKIKQLTNSADMYDVLERFLVKEFAPIDKTWTMEKFTALSEESLRLLLKSDSLATQSENTIFVALMKWIRINIQQFSCDKLGECRLLDVVRFEFMSVEFLYDIVQHHYLAKRMHGFNKYLLQGLAYHGFSQIRREQLEPTPKKRPLLKENGPTFSWVIGEELEKSLSNLLEIPFFSDIFWFQGYELKLSLSYTNDLSKFSFYLYVLNMAKEACLHVKCVAKSVLFVQPVRIDHLFTKKGNAWGYRQREKNTAQKRKSYTIDVWVTFAQLDT